MVLKHIFRGEIIMFFRFSIDLGKRFAGGVIIGNYPSKKINCSVCRREWVKDLLLDEQVQLTIALSGSRFPDFLGCVYTELISEKVREVFIKKNITRYHLGEIQILSANTISLKDKKELRRDGLQIKNIAVEPPNYYRLFIDGKAELHEKSGIVLVEKCEVCGYQKYRPKDKNNFFPTLYLKDGSWDGSDLFRVKEFPAVVFCSERFVEIYKKNNLTGLLFDKVDII